MLCLAAVCVITTVFCVFVANVARVWTLVIQVCNDLNIHSLCYENYLVIVCVEKASQQLYSS